MTRKVYIMDNLDCANCAAKIEQKFKEHEAVQDAVITFSTGGSMLPPYIEKSNITR